MLKNIINRNCKDTTWIRNFIQSKLNNEIAFNGYATDKMVYAIAKSGRYLKNHIDRWSTVDNLHYYDGQYYIYVDVNKPSKYGTFKMIIKDIEACKNDYINTERCKCIERLNKDHKGNLEAIEAFTNWFDTYQTEHLKNTYEIININLESETARKLRIEYKENPLRCETLDKLYDKYEH